MKPAKEERPVTTPFGQKGSSWATGEHGGIDYGCPTGDPVYAMWDGTVTSKSWGSAYGTHIVIDHDHLPNGDPGLWAVYAHLSSKSVSSGAKVKAGQQIGKSGATGNVTGPHLHVEVQRDSSWQQGNYVDPQPWVDAVKPGDVYLSKLVYGQEDSDSVRRLQQALNAHSLQPPGDQTLPVTGNYAEMTDEVVRADQQQHGYGDDPVGASSVGPQQAEHLFAGTGNTIINDLPTGETPPDPEDPGAPEPPQTIKFPLGIEYHYSGKPSGTFTFTTYKKLDVASWAPSKPGFTFGMIYANVDGSGEFKSRLIREDPPDETAYQTHYPKSGDHYLMTHVWFEKAEANRKLHYELGTADGETMHVGTRYAKFLFIPQDVVVAIGELGTAYMAARRTALSIWQRVRKAAA